MSHSNQPKHKLGVTVNSKKTDFTAAKGYLRASLHYLETGKMTLACIYVDLARQKMVSA